MPILKFAKPRPRAVVYSQEIAYSHLCVDDQRQFDEANHTPDPYEVLTAKVAHLAELLGCSEAEAENILLDRIGNSAFGSL